MIRATLTTRRVRRMEEGALHKWLKGRGINTANQIKRTNQTNGITLFKQYQRDTLKGRRRFSLRRFFSRG